MGKRSDFKRIARDNYPTPIEAVRPLVPHLQRAKFHFTEPCAGDGRLAMHIEALTSGKCERWSDIEPRRDGIAKADALVEADDMAAMFITNPPWGRAILHPLILKLSDIAPAWLLFDADWMHTKQAAPFMPRLRKVVSVGRVKWIEGSKMTGKDNCCWYLFSTPDDEPAQFYGRTLLAQGIVRDGEAVSASDRSPAKPDPVGDAPKTLQS